MNPFKAIQEAMTKMVDAFKSKANEALKKLPPIEQVAASQELGWALNSLQFAGERINELGDHFMEQMSSAIAQIDGLIETEVQAALSKKIEEDGLVAKDVHEAALQAARTEVDAKVAEAMKRKETIEARRGQFAAELPEGADVSGLSEETLGAEEEEFKARLGALRQRVEKVKELGGLTPKMGTRLAFLSASEEDEASFEATCEVIREARTAGGGAAPRPPASGQFAAVAAAGGDRWAHLTAGN